MLSHLPDELLSALAHGLERHAGRLQVGRLYADYDGGGCAVGVMLRELSPAEYRQGRLQFWARRHRHHSVLTERLELDRSLVTRLSHVEMCFDVTALSMCEQAPQEDVHTVANATGRWLAEGCREHLRSRHRAGRSGFFVPREWLGLDGRRPAGARRAPVSRRASTALRKVSARDGADRLVMVARQPRSDNIPTLLAMSALRRVTGHKGTQTLVTVPVGDAVPPAVETPDATLLASALA